ncbi:MAG: 4-hydroxy-tetrahydrodipicolinate reductase [Christensenellaceae bacterium]|nr:4-hydroxy-tetrahydrodipicolinate reductase [Christensenellaceae bacterium]
MNIILSGCLGRMGKAISENAAQADIAVVAGVDAFGEGTASYPIYKNINEVTEKADCIIDFSHFSALKSLGEYALNKSLPIILATTGYSVDDLAYIGELSKSIPVLQTSNLSLGVQVLRHVAEQASKILSGLYDVEIIERHHNQKKDSPSGTAFMLYEAVKKAESEAIYGRHGNDCLRKEKEIGIHAIRGGGVPGEHEVGFYGIYDEILLTHRARDRRVFAIGALTAAKFLAKQKSGLYTTADVVKDRLNF